MSASAGKMCIRDSSKSFRFSDINYLVASREDKESMFLTYSELLNSLDSGATTKITINNHRLNRSDFEESILMPMKQDGLDEYRKEYNAVSYTHLKKNALLPEGVKVLCRELYCGIMYAEVRYMILSGSLDLDRKSAIGFLPWHFIQHYFSFSIWIFGIPPYFPTKYPLWIFSVVRVENSLIVYNSEAPSLSRLSTKYS